MMKKVIAISALLMLSTVVFAVGERTFDFTPPTTYEDGTPLAQASIASYDIECDGALLVNLVNVPLETDTYFAPPGTFSEGNHACEAFTITTSDVRSGPSNTVNFTVAPGTPGPPINFAVH